MDLRGYEVIANGSQIDLWCTRCRRRIATGDPQDSDPAVPLAAVLGSATRHDPAHRAGLPRLSD